MHLVYIAILTLKVEDAEKLNDMIINNFSGKQHSLLWFDEVEGDIHHLYQ